MSENEDLKHQAVEGRPDLLVHSALANGLILTLTLSFIISVGLFCLGEGSGILKQMSATLVCIFIAQEFFPLPSADTGAKLRKKVVLSRTIPIP
jgi:hypothetical protein